MPLDEGKLDAVFFKRAAKKLGQLDKALARKAKSIVPVRTGRLKASIKPLPIVVTATEITGGIVADTPYARQVELLYNAFLGETAIVAPDIWKAKQPEEQTQEEN